MERLSSVIGKHYLTFSLVFSVALVLFVLYTVLAPEQTHFNFSPFPTVSPKDLPDNKIAGNSCYDTLTQCDAMGGCSKCTSEFSCTRVEEGGQRYVFNNLPVPAGDFCLPSISQDTGTCNVYTGQWLWTSGADKQKWECDCLYPSVYSGSDCGTQVACQNQFIERFRPNAQSPQLLANSTLKSTADIPGTNIKKGTEWNPNASGADAAEVLKINPLSVLPDGSPMFACDCDSQNASGVDNFVPTLKLPNDPYNCHLDPCLTLQGNAYSAPNCLQSECKDKQEVTKPSCSCADVNQKAADPNTPASGLCFAPSLFCNLQYDDGTYHMGNYNSDTKKCNCADTSGTIFGTSRDCTTDPTKVTGTLPLCSVSTNLLGQECYSPCGDYSYRNPNDGQQACGPCHFTKNTCFYTDPSKGQDSYWCGGAPTSTPPPTTDYIGCCGTVGPTIDDAIGLAQTTTLGGIEQNCTKPYYPKDSVVMFQPNDNPDAIFCDSKDKKDFSTSMIRNSVYATGTVDFSHIDSNNYDAVSGVVKKAFNINWDENATIGPRDANSPCQGTLTLESQTHGTDSFSWGLYCSDGGAAPNQSVKDNLGDNTNDGHWGGFNMFKCKSGPD